MLLLAAAAAALIALAAVIGFLTLRGDDEEANGGTASGALAEAGCTVRTVTAQNRDHVDAPRPGFKYNTDPPTSGPHFGIPAPFDFYNDPVEQFRLVHNLEHGAVVIQYGDDISDETVQEIQDWYLEDPNGLVVAPYPRLGNRIALTAWTEEEDSRYGSGHVARCPRFDEDAFDEFLDEYGFRGPEPFPRSALTPGT